MLVRGNAPGLPPAGGLFVIKAAVARGRRARWPCRAGQTEGVGRHAYHLLYSAPMSRSTTLPPIRVTPETRASVEAALREGESLTQFIENAVCQEAEFRAKQNAAVARAKKSLLAADQGVGLMTAEDFLADMHKRAQAAQQRIRDAVVSGKKKRGAG